jgi:hypothetical protein
MLFDETRLRSKDKHTLVEIKSSDGTSDRGFEWRRAFNFLSFRSTDFEIRTTLGVNDIDLMATDLPEDQEDEVVRNHQIRGDSAVRTEITTKMELDSVVDNYYTTSTIDRNEEIFSASPETRIDRLTLNIREGNPVERNTGAFLAGAYPGLAFFDEDNEALFIDVTVSKETIERLCRQIDTVPRNDVLIKIGIASFSSEVDDAVWEGRYSRDLLIHGEFTEAFLRYAVIRARDESVDGSNEPSPPDERSVDEELIDGNTTGAAKGYLIKDIAIDTSALNSIKYALWVLVGVLLLFLLK